MELVPTQLPEIVLIKPRVFGDHRGHFLEIWKQSDFDKAGIDATFVQDNHSRSKQWTMRGLHYQIQQAQGKLVCVTQGSVYDIAVDMRRSSPTFGQWVGAELSDVNHHMLWIPPGFAHGFLTLSPTADFLYKCTDFYAAPFERAVRWNDPDLGIEWPLPAGVTPLLADKDANACSLREAECFP